MPVIVTFNTTNNNILYNTRNVMYSISDTKYYYYHHHHHHHHYYYYYYYYYYY